MKRTNKLSLFATMLMMACASMMFYSCNEDPDENEPSNNAFEKGYYVLCEGLWGRNNSSLDFFSSEKQTTTIDLFTEVNNAGLGETANDMIEADGKLFIAVNGSNCVMVVNKADCKRLALIPITAGENPQPRCLAYYNGRIYLTCFDGTIYKINASTYKIEKTAKTQGRNPEAIAVCNGKLFVANTGGLDHPNFDSTISVINPDDLSLLHKIEGLLNPGAIKVSGNHVFVQARGIYDYSAGSYSNAELAKINATTYQIEERIPFIANAYELVGNKIVYAYMDNSMKNYIYSIPTDNLASSPQTFISTDTGEPSKLKYVYNINADNEHIYITDAKDYQTNGECFVFDCNGTLECKFETFINPKKVTALQ